MRQLKKAIAMLLLAGVSVTIPYIYSLLFAQDEPNNVHLPIASNGQSVMRDPKTSRSKMLVDGQPVTIMENEFGIQASMPATGTLEDIKLFNEKGEYIPSPAEKALGEILAQKNARNESIPVGGPSTAGGTILIAAKTVTLTEDIFISGVVVGITCMVGDPCMQPPVYVLEQSKTGHLLAISGATGQIGDPAIPADELALLKQEFSAVVDQIEVKK